MKKGLKKLGLIALALVCTLGFFGKAQAQETPKDGSTTEQSGGKKPSKLSFGLQSGLNLSEYFIAGSEGRTDRAAGVQAGAFFTIQATNWVGISLELAYAQNGAKNLAGLDNPSKRFSFIGHNFQTNLLTYFKLPILSVYEPKFIIGPSLNYMVQQDFMSETISGTSGVKTWHKYTGFQNMDFGMIVGLGLDFDLKWATLLVDARYRQGFSDINSKGKAIDGTTLNTSYNDNTPASTLGNNSMSNSTFSFNLGLGFKL